VTKIH